MELFSLLDRFNSSLFPILFCHCCVSQPCLGSILSPQKNFLNLSAGEKCLHKTFDINESDGFSCRLQTVGAIKEGGMSMEGEEDKF
jgi:hypothetical protein